MMVDAKERDLTIGDLVLVPAVVTGLYANEYIGCCLQLTSCFGDEDENCRVMWPVEAGIVLRANEDDDNDLEEFYAVENEESD